MQKVRVPINSFQYGEISPSTAMRSDTPIYASSASSLENLLVLAEGAVKKRPGLKSVYHYSDVTYAASNQGESHLFHFVFSEDERYIISVEHGKVRCFFLDDSGVYGTAGDVVLVETITQDTSSNPLPFHNSYVKEYTYAQVGDVMFICHPLFMPRMLVRTALDSFEITPYSFDVRADNKKTYQPYYSFQGKGVTLDPSDVTGSITLTVSEDYFVSDHVGTIIRYGESEIEITGVTNATTATGTVIDSLRLRLAVLDPLRTIDGSATIEVTQIEHGFSGGEAITVENASAVGGINATQINGARTVGTIIDRNTYTITAGATANESVDGGGYVSIVTHAPTDRWDEQSFSAVRGYPAAVAMHENRLVFGGTIAQPDTMWFSRSATYFNFDFGDAEDNDAFDLTASTGDVNTIRYMVSNRDLQVFTDSAELYVPTFLNQAITPTTAQVRKQTPYGCEFTMPHPFDGATLFAQAGGSVVREYLYTDTENAYTSTAISTVASHLITNPRYLAVSNGAFSQAESYAALSNGNGDIALFSSNRAERRAAWTRITTQGDFHSVLGVGDRMFANVWFNDNSDYRMFLCEFTGDIGLDRYISASVGTYHVDVSAAYEVGDVVNVIGYNQVGPISSDESDENYLGEFTVVDNGGVASIDVSEYLNYQNFYVGILFPINLTTNAIDVNIGNGPATGQPRGVSTVVLDLIDSRSATVNGRPLVTSTSFSGKKEFRLLGYSRDPKVTIAQNEPMPLQINGLIAELIL